MRTHKAMPRRCAPSQDGSLQSGRLAGPGVVSPPAPSGLLAGEGGRAQVPSLPQRALRWLPFPRPWLHHGAGVGVGARSSGEEEGSGSLPGSASPSLPAPCWPQPSRWRRGHAHSGCARQHVPGGTCVPGAGRWPVGPERTVWRVGWRPRGWHVTLVSGFRLLGSGVILFTLHGGPELCALLLQAQTREVTFSVTFLVSPGYKWLGREHIPGESDTEPSFYPELSDPRTSRHVGRVTQASPERWCEGWTEQGVSGGGHS